MHPSTEAILSHFSYDHLPPQLLTTSKRFHDLAHTLVDDLDLEGPELTTGLRKLLEAKDCAVRAMIEKLRRDPPAP